MPFYHIRPENAQNISPCYTAESLRKYQIHENEMILFIVRIFYSFIPKQLTNLNIRAMCLTIA